ncbi:hypothetical protein Scep_011802 [Stephania cephalantha]|uniref:Non-haem dioxygenase N-terminal domain-containing protein n=1 Tax=Stephania cephalantha TaxID=152367 RepID=A0AAP0JE30_9MAGN
MSKTSIHQMFDEVPSDYDRRNELKAFDDTKAGVRGLVEAGVTKIPRIFITPSDRIDNWLSSNDGQDFKIPAIDLEGINVGNRFARRKEILDEVKLAVETWGFFQVVNHGIPVDILDGMLNRVPPSANWRDTLLCMTAPDSLNLDELPAVFRFSNQAHTLFMLHIWKQLREYSE